VISFVRYQHLKVHQDITLVSDNEPRVGGAVGFRVGDFVGTDARVI
jgi:hypothetical protein